MKKSNKTSPHFPCYGSGLPQERDFTTEWSLGLLHCNCSPIIRSSLRRPWICRGIVIPSLPHSLNETHCNSFLCCFNTIRTFSHFHAIIYNPEIAFEAAINISPRETLLVASKSFSIIIFLLLRQDVEKFWYCWRLCKTCFPSSKIKLETSETYKSVQDLTVSEWGCFWNVMYIRELNIAEHGLKMFRTGLNITQNRILKLRLLNKLAKELDNDQDEMKIYAPRHSTLRIPTGTCVSLFSRTTK